jgi:hypothetical protein
LFIFISIFIYYFTILSVISIGRLEDNEIEMTWMEEVAAEFEALSWNLSGGTEENHGMPQSTAMFRLAVQAKHSKESTNNKDFPEQACRDSGFVAPPHILVSICWYYVP